MRVLAIGATGFIGPWVVDELIRHGHSVTVYRRGRSGSVPAEAQEIVGDRNNLGAHVHRFRRLAPDVVVDFILSNGLQARGLMDVFRGIAGRIVALSSADVYRAAGLLHGTEPGPLQPVPLTEESELRTRLNPYPRELVKTLQKRMSWLGDEYDKIPVERTVMGDPDLAGTVLRLPMIYGPGDMLHRFYPILKRIRDGRTAIFFHEKTAAWRGPRGYVENVASAIALAATDGRAKGRIYNVAQPGALPEMEWSARIGAAAGWRGSVIELDPDRTPAHLQPSGNYDQHWSISSARIREELGYKEPVELETALSRTVDWELANPPEEIDPKAFDYAAEDLALANTASHLRAIKVGRSVATGL
jgi:nucleoside-diphosphate-sugar epimerase